MRRKGNKKKPEDVLKKPVGKMILPTEVWTFGNVLKLDLDVEVDELILHPKYFETWEDMIFIFHYLVHCLLFNKYFWIYGVLGKLSLTLLKPAVFKLSKT